MITNMLKLAIFLILMIPRVSTADTRMDWQEIKLISSERLEIGHGAFIGKQNDSLLISAGFTVEERSWFDRFLSKGYIDTFREYVKDGGNYTWWTYRNNARKRNIGWRIDYFVISQILKRKLINSNILKNIKGSDHCPISMEIKD